MVVRSDKLPLGTYAFVLEPADGDRTRLIVRDRASWKRSELLFAVLVFEPLHGYMETGLITGLRQRTQSSPAPRS